MLKGAAACSGFAVDDVPRAKEFYGSTLMPVTRDSPSPQGDVPLRVVFRH
jgi:hypothetical protein